jgi:hypothetical protein
MIRHVVMFRWTPETTTAHVHAIQEALGGLSHTIEEIRSYSFGTDVGINEGNFDFVVVAEFQDVADYVAYRDHPMHQAVIRDLITTHIAERAAVQYDLGEAS